jgi:hypothetical protein
MVVDENIARSKRRVVLRITWRSHAMHPFICLLYGWTIKIEAVAHKIYSYASVYYFIIYVVQYIGRRKSFFSKPHNSHWTAVSSVAQATKQASRFQRDDCKRRR